MEVNGKKTVFYYLVDKEQRKGQEIILRPQVATVHVIMERVAEQAKKRDLAVQQRIAVELKKGPKEEMKPRKRTTSRRGRK